MSKVRKSILLISGQNYIGFALQLLSSIVIARLLTPGEIGIYSVAMVFLGFAYTFRDFGVANYLIQEKDLTPDKIRSAFAMTLMTGWTLALAIWLGSGFVAAFYHEPGIREIMHVISLNFMLIPFGVIPMAYMNRQMDFVHIALIRVISNIVSTSASIWLAYAGFSFLSMAWGSVAGIVVTFFLAQQWRPKGLPLLPGLKEMRSVVSFGSLSSLVMIFNDMSQGAPEMILGRLSGMATVGYFGRAMGLLSMFSWGSVAGIISTFFLAQLWRPAGLPLLPGLKAIRQVASFGSLSSLMMILNDLSQGAPDMILGRLSGMATVGYFGRAMGLLSMFDKFVMGSLWGVAMPHFAEQSRKEGGIKDTFLSAMSYITALAWPFYICLGLLANPVIVVMYGEQWASSVSLLRLLCISSVITAPYLLMSTVMIAIGQMKQSLYQIAIHVPIRIAFLLLSAQFGLEAVGATFIVSSLIDSTVCYLQGRSILHVNLPEIAKALSGSAGVAIVAMLPALFVFMLEDGILAGQLWLQLIFGITGCSLAWLAAIFWFRHPLRIEIVNLFSMLSPYISPLK